jgi:acyl-CoA synthetase (AMP-forming)/AMP-acid ligase II
VTRSYFATTENKSKQGAAFLTADDIRVVKMIPDGEEWDGKPLQEVRMDGVEVGEIVFRGNIVMKGYYKNADATRKAFAGGYFHVSLFGVVPVVLAQTNRANHNLDWRFSSPIC